MIESLCRAQALVALMDESEKAGRFKNGRARSPAYREHWETAGAYMIDRVRDGLALPGEVLEQFSTCRGLAKVLGYGHTAVWDMLQKFKTLSFFAHRPILRRWQSNTQSRTQGSNPYWLMPTIWRMGEALAKFFADVTDTGTDLATSLLENRYRTRGSRRGLGSSSDGTENILQAHQSLKDRSATCPVSVKPTEIEVLIGSVNRLSAKLDAEGQRPATIEEAETAVRDTETAVHLSATTNSREDHERLQRAVTACKQAYGLLELAKVAASMARPRSFSFAFVDPKAPPKPHGYW